MAASATGERTLKETATWAVALVCAVFVIISILIEHGIHSLGKVRPFSENDCHDIICGIGSDDLSFLL